MKIGLFDKNVMSYGLKNARSKHFPRPWWRCLKVGKNFFERIVDDVNIYIKICDQ